LKFNFEIPATLGCLPFTIIMVLTSLLRCSISRFVRVELDAAACRTQSIKMSGRRYIVAPAAPSAAPAAPRLIKYTYMRFETRYWDARAGLCYFARNAFKANPNNDGAPPLSF